MADFILRRGCPLAPRSPTESNAMTTNPYVAPRSTLVAPPSPATGVPFYVVSARKFTWLFIATMGHYGIYWFYRNWHLYRQYSGSRIWPVARAIFAVFFVHSLFALVKDALAEEGKLSWHAGRHAALMVILMLLSFLVDKLASESVGPPQLVWLLIPLFALQAFVWRKAQVIINVSCHDPDGQSNDRFTAANFFWMALGALYWALFLVGASATL